MDRETERRLVRSAGRDPGAFGRLYDEHFPRILSYCLRRLGHLTDAEDATAETFLKALRGIRRFRWRGGGLLPWLYRIAEREVVNLQRRRTRSRRELRDHVPTPVRLELEEAEARLEGRELALALIEALGQLERRDQAIVALHYLQGEKYSLVAESVGMKEGAVRVRAHRALRRLEGLLGKEGWDHDKARAAGWAAGLFGDRTGVPGLPETAVGI